MLCPVRALKLYVDRSKVWWKSSQLLVCFGAGRRGLATSKQRISHWVRDHGWANASMPRVIGKLRENQSRHWDDSWEAKRSTSASPNRFQIWDSVWRFNIRSPGLSFCLDRKSAARFSIPGTWTALKERNLSWDQRRRRRASLSMVHDREPPWRLMWDTTAILSVLTIIWCSPRTGRKCIKARKTDLSSRQFMCQEGTLLSIPRAPVCLRRLRPSPSLMRLSWSYGDGESHPFPINSLTPWSGPEWASRPSSSEHECTGTSRGPVQHPCTSLTFSVPRPGRREGPCIVSLPSKGKPKMAIIWRAMPAWPAALWDFPIRAEVVLHGLVGRRGRDFQEGAKEGEDGRLEFPRPQEWRCSPAPQNPQVWWSQRLASW